MASVSFSRRTEMRTRSLNMHAFCGGSYRNNTFAGPVSFLSCRAKGLSLIDLNKVAAGMFLLGRGSLSAGRAVHHE